MDEGVSCKFCRLQTYENLIHLSAYSISIFGIPFLTFFSYIHFPFHFVSPNPFVMKIYDDKHIKNIVLLGAVKSGKTLLAEDMLFEAGIVHRRGTIEGKN